MSGRARKKTGAIMLCVFFVFAIFLVLLVFQKPALKAVSPPLQQTPVQVQTPVQIQTIAQQPDAPMMPTSSNSSSQVSRNVSSKENKPGSVLPRPASTPTSVPAPSMAISAASPFGLSLATTLVALNDAQLRAELNDISSLGASWIRIDLDWRAVQPRQSSTYDWSRYDRIVAAARNAHLQVLPILLDTPSWARPEGCSAGKCPPADVHEFADFAHAAAAHFSGDGVHAWEIWNEPNMAGSWGGQADPASYAHMLQAAYPAIKAADPSSVVVTGGLGPIGTGDGNIAPLEFLSRLYADGAGPYFDAVGFHPYSFPVPPSYDISWSAWSQMSQTKTSVRSIMIKNGDGDKKIWITEYGAPTNGPGNEATPDNFTSVDHADHVSEDMQAMMADEAVTVVKQYPWAGPVFWYSYRDLGTATDNTENFYGILRNDGSRKPAYDALKSAIAR